jgi:hypothetical protein
VNPSVERWGDREDLLRKLLGELRDLVRAGFEREGTARTEEVRQFIRRNRRVPEFKKLAITVLLLAEAFRAENEGEEWKGDAWPSSSSPA